MSKQLPAIRRGVLTNVVMPIPMRAALEQRAADEKTSMSAVVRRLLAPHLSGGDEVDGGGSRQLPVSRGVVRRQ